MRRRAVVARPGALVREGPVTAARVREVLGLIPDELYAEMLRPSAERVRPGLPAGRAGCSGWRGPRRVRQRRRGDIARVAPRRRGGQPEGMTERAVAVVRQTNSRAGARGSASSFRDRSIGAAPMRRTGVVGAQRQQLFRHAFGWPPTPTRSNARQCLRGAVDELARSAPPSTALDQREDAGPDRVPRWSGASRVQLAGISPSTRAPRGGDGALLRTRALVEQRQRVAHPAVGALRNEMQSVSIDRQLLGLGDLFETRDDRVRAMRPEVEALQP